MASNVGLLFLFFYFILYANGAGRAGANSGYEYANALWLAFMIGAIGLLVNVFRKKTRTNLYSLIATTIWIVIFLTTIIADFSLISVIYTVSFFPVVVMFNGKINNTPKAQFMQTTIVSTLTWFLYMYTFCYYRNSTKLYAGYATIPAMYIGSILNFVSFLLAIVQPFSGKNETSTDALNQSNQSISQPQHQQVQPQFNGISNTQPVQQYQPVNNGMSYPNHPQPINLNAKGNF